MKHSVQETGNQINLLQRNLQESTGYIKTNIADLLKKYESQSSKHTFDELFYHHILHEIAHHFGRHSRKWENLFQLLSQDAPQNFFTHGLNDIQNRYTTDFSKAYECLVIWKTGIRKHEDIPHRLVELLKEEAFELCNRIENEVEKFKADNEKTSDGKCIHIKN